MRWFRQVQVLPKDAVTLGYGVFDGLFHRCVAGHGRVSNPAPGQPLQLVGVVALPGPELAAHERGQQVLPLRRGRQVLRRLQRVPPAGQKATVDRRPRLHLGARHPDQEIHYWLNHALTVRRVEHVVPLVGAVYGHRASHVTLRLRRQRPAETVADAPD